jgi:hypothetical protein
MTLDELENFFEIHNDQFLKTDNIKKRMSPRPDLCAFLILDELQFRSNFVKSYGDIVTHAEHEIIYLGVNLENILSVITEADILDLIRCGVCFNSDESCFTMFASG